MGHNLSHNELIEKLVNEEAKPSEYREYERRVTARSTAAKCESGHPDCALVEDGPCAAMAAAMGYLSDKDDW